MVKKIRWTEVEDYKNFKNIVKLEFDSDSSLVDAKTKGKIAASFIDRSMQEFASFMGSYSPESSFKKTMYNSNHYIFWPLYENEKRIMARPKWTVTEEIDNAFKQDSIGNSARFPFLFFNRVNNNYVKEFSQQYRKSISGHYIIPQARIMTFGRNKDE